ncbi:geminin coiled-coil domain-containing protein 1 isoform X1 [Syngnathus scovelli]|uniref:geminin coiled-coil domain-containing protein 1 isoform X1 n=1 Tax=Syngnathus scovelli TaxID=161590 RepID=UPI00211059B4|nr:geminin coiled-coil domain-containing protein 1 isoform X2 [Syngnathus scovelli]
METLTNTWSLIDQCNVPNVGDKHSSCPWEECVFNRSPQWSEQLSAHLQRNKQLEDTLLQREEELSRLQEENHKLRQFLNSSFVKNLDDKAGIPDKTWNLNRKRPCNSVRRHPQVSKRICRNLSAEFNSTESSSAESSSFSSELDLWVLRTLGLKDPDTIDTSSMPTVYQENFSPEQSDCSYGSTESLQSHPAFMASTPDHRSPPQEPPISELTHFGQTPFNSPLLNCSWSPQSPSQVGQGESGHPDLAFAMSLNPASSVKTLSYPQGQAFVRRDPQGHYNFTWLPTHTSSNMDRT